MIDLSDTIIADSDQLNADDLLGNPITIKITKVTKDKDKDKDKDKGKRPVSIFYEAGGDKPWKPCKTMLRAMIRAWGTDGGTYVGRSLTLFRDEKVELSGLQVGGTRISNMSGIDQPITMLLTERRGRKKAYTINPLASAPATASEIPDSVLEKILIFGAAAASDGVASYSDWLKPLDAKAKAAIKHKHSEWSAIAKEADRNKAEDLPL